MPFRFDNSLAFAPMVIGFFVGDAQDKREKAEIIESRGLSEDEVIHIGSYVGGHPITIFALESSKEVESSYHGQRIIVAVTGGFELPTNSNTVTH